MKRSGSRFRAGARGVAQNAPPLRVLESPGSMKAGNQLWEIPQQRCQDQGDGKEFDS